MHIVVLLPLLDEFAQGVDHCLGVESSGDTQLSVGWMHQGGLVINESWSLFGGVEKIWVHWELLMGNVVWVGGWVGASGYAGRVRSLEWEFELMHGGVIEWVDGME